MTHSYFSGLNLQLFADGGAAAGSGAGDSGTSAPGATADSGLATAPNKGVKNPLATVVYGKQAEDVQNADAQPTEPKQTEVPDDRNAKFEALIKGEFKDLYDARVQNTIQQRLKGTKDTVDKYNALLPVLETLSHKYNVKADDLDGLTKAIEEDDSLWESEALERGVSVEQYKEIRKMEKENAELKRQMAERETKEKASQIYAGWLDQAEKLKSVYPSFALEAEMQNPKFTDLLRNNIDVRTAYEVTHRDEIISGAMTFAAQKAEQKVANRVIANGQRVAENGMNKNSSVMVKPNVSQLTKADREEIARRVSRGEKISF